MGNLLKKHVKATQAAKHRLLIPNHLVSESTDPSQHPNSKFLTNRIKTTKYTAFSFFPKNMFEQFHRFANLYFVFIVLLNWVPQVNAFGKEVAMIPLLFVLGVTAVKDAYEDYRRYRSDKRINRLPCMVYCRKERQYVKQEWSEVKVGDIIRITCNEVIPADVILLRSSDECGICHIDTSNLDGENNLKQREIIKGLHHQGAEFHPSMFTHTIECEIPNIEIYKFHGACQTPLGQKIPVSKDNVLLRGCIIRNTDFVEGIVVYAGHDTKALMNNRGPRHKRSKLERQINRDVVWCVIILFVMCFCCSLGSGLWLGTFDDPKAVPYIPYETSKEYEPAYQGFVRFWTYIILFQVMIPLSLYVTIELVKLGQVYFINNDIQLYHETSGRSMECRALNITEDLGQVQYVFSDKTGTLTENQMDFKRCTIGGVDYSYSKSDADLYIATGKNEPEDHTYIQINGGLSGTVAEDHVLHREVSRMSLNNMEGDVRLDIPVECRRIRDFFLLMAICNTVVVSATDHHAHDQFNRSSTQESTFSPVSLEKYSRLSNSKGAGAEKKSAKKRKLSKKLPGSFTRNSDITGRIPLENDDELESSATNSSAGDTSLAYESLNASMMSESTLKTKYEAESPDELALVKAACTYGCRLVKRTPEMVTIWLPAEGETSIEVRHILHFDSSRKRMSVIVRHPVTKEIILYCKGADTAIIPNLKHEPGDTAHETLIQKTQEQLNGYAKQGLRTLVMSKRVIAASEYKAWLPLHEAAESALENRESLLYESACKIETDLELLGATGIEDKLQGGVPETIAALRQAGMKVWVLTGDKQETALNIAYSCQLISFDQELIVVNARNKDMARDLIQGRLEYLEGDCCNSVDSEGDPVELTNPSEMSRSTYLQGHKDRALVIDGRTLAFALNQNLEGDFLRLAQQCSSVLCVRATPFQKAAVVKLVRDKLHKLTLAIGDGANDVSMIQTADIGLGISGQEGMQAVMASDFALARFRFLQRLLFVHGHWCYDRLARMTLYMFYKNAVFIFMLLWFQVYSGFSGGTFLDDMNLILFNLVYTSLLPIISGVFDQDVSSATLMRKPHLYRQGPNCEVYRRHSYFICILDAIWQSLVEFFVPYFTYAGSSTGIWEFGMTCNAGCVWATLLHQCIETRHWNAFHWAVLFLSITVFYSFNIVFDMICLNCSPPANPYWVAQHTFSSPIHWFCVALVVMLALAPRFIVRALEGSLWPSHVLRARKFEKSKAAAKLEHHQLCTVYAGDQAQEGVCNSSEVVPPGDGGSPYTYHQDPLPEDGAQPLTEDLTSHV